MKPHKIPHVPYFVWVLVYVGASGDEEERQRQLNQQQREKRRQQSGYGDGRCRTVGKREGEAKSNATGTVKPSCFVHTTRKRKSKATSLKWKQVNVNELFTPSKSESNVTFA